MLRWMGDTRSNQLNKTLLTANIVKYKYKSRRRRRGVFLFCKCVERYENWFSIHSLLNSPTLPRTSCSWIYFCFLSFNLLLMVFSALQAVLLTMGVVVEFYMILYSMYYLIRTTHNANYGPSSFFKQRIIYLFEPHTMQIRPKHY